jgi:hypothetical protein
MTTPPVNICYDDGMYMYSGWKDMFYCISPHSWAYMGVALSIGLSIIGAAWYETFLKYIINSLLLIRFKY